MMIRMSVPIPMPTCMRPLLFGCTAVTQPGAQSSWAGPGGGRRAAGRFAGTLEGSPDGLALKPRFETHFQLAPKLGLRQGCPTYSGALAAELAHTAALDGRRISGSGSPGHD